MPQPFFHHRQHVLARFGEHQTLGVQSDRSQAGREKVRLLHDPQHRAGQPSQDTGDEQSRRRGLFGIRSGTRGFVQGPQRQTARREGLIDSRHAQANAPPGLPARIRPPYARDAIAEVAQD